MSALTLSSPACDDRRARALFEAILKGYCAHLDARNCKPKVVDARASELRRLQRALGWPWYWEVAEWERWQSERARAGIVLGTRRDEQILVESFSHYMNSPEYHWAQDCLRLFGRAPTCVITEANRLLHVEELESGVQVRPATRAEIQRLFDFIDAEVVRRMRRGKGALTAYRDGMYLKLCYAFGPRRAEGCGIELCDWHRNVRLPRFGDWGALVIRNGKAKPFGPPRRRTVYTTPLMDWIVPELERYAADVRPLYRAARGDSHFFLNDWGDALQPEYASKEFRSWADAAGVDPAVTLHSLRRSYATHHLEAGYQGAFLSDQLGHEWESSTAVYTMLSDDYREQQLLAAEAAMLN